MPFNESLYATCASGLQNLLAEELRELGAKNVSTAGAGVRFTGGLEIAYKACLWSRVANRILLPIHTGTAATPEALYDVVKEVDWSTHMALQSTLAVDFFTANSAITHSQYGALKVKDAIVDQFREKSGERPNVERETPDLRVNVYLFRDKARIAIDLSGSSLHRRGYREQAGPAPVKENLAASLLLASDWPARAKRGEAFADPLCGSGTLVIEAAMIACNMAPGLKRSYFGFTGWLGFDNALWQRVLRDAENAVTGAPCMLTGTDKDKRAIALASDNAKLAGVESVVQFHHEDVLDERNQVSASAGLVLTNPPYGERLEIDARFYEHLGSALSRHYAGWDCAIFTATSAPVRQMRLPLKATLSTRNGPIDCSLYGGRVPSVSSAVSSASATDADAQRSGASNPSSALLDNESVVDASGAAAGASAVWANAAASRHQSDAAAPYDSTDQGGENAEVLEGGTNTLAVDAQPFANRIKKNLKRLKSWQKRERAAAWRVYDADLPEFAVAIDIYDCEQGGSIDRPGGDRHVVVQEYQAPATVNTVMAEARLHAVLSAIPEALSVRPEQVHLKVREKQTGLSQYEKQSAKKITGLIREYDYVLECNFTDYLDTGVFLDHRKIRRFIQQQSASKRFLNLFSYTGSATIAAASGGASSSVSVDLSNRYSQWLTRNLRHNGLSEKDHEVVRSDVSHWLGNYQGPRFDLILLDPPTFSNSTGIDADWNVQRDHVACIRQCMHLLEPDGILMFSNNFRRFKLDASLGDVVTEKKGARPAAGKKTAPRGSAPPGASSAGGDSAQAQYRIEERTYWSIDDDFQRNARIHQCWFISHS